MAELVAVQILAKCEACKLYPRWSRDLDQYRLVVRYVSSIVQEVSEWARHIIEKTRFLEKIDTANSVHEIIEACYEVWKESEGILDLCP